jgi:hypothetical protein
VNSACISVLLMMSDSSGKNVVCICIDANTQNNSSVTDVSLSISQNILGVYFTSSGHMPIWVGPI